MSARRRRGGRNGSPDPGRERDRPDTFADALDGIVPLPGRDRSIPPLRQSPRATPRAPRSAAEPARFTHPDPGEPGLGFASGIRTSQLRRLRGGEIRPEREIDLHSLRAAGARSALLAGLREAITRGERCVLVIHGKGRRSQQSPVLRTALPDWLADPALKAQVLAFAPAAPEDGGSGATYVLLRRRRE